MAGTEETHVASMRNAGKSASEGQMSDDVAVDQDSPNVNVSAFDFSIENHFQMMDMILELCQIGEKQEAFDVVEMERMSSMITFIREWRQFCYKPRTIKFACETGPPHGKHVVEGVNFPQYSAASVPKMKNLSSDNEIFETGRLFDGKDFVVYVGGPVWALDWCPTVLERSDSRKRCEYLAVSAHPPESSYHKIGAPLTGRGIVQVWCLLNTDVKNEESSLLKKQRGRPRKHTTTDISLGALDGGNHVVQELAEPKKRGRPRKQTTTKESLGASDGGNQVVQELAEPKKRGRPRKQTTTKESLGALDGVNQVVQELAVQVINSDQECLPMQKGQPRKHIATMGSLGTLDGGNQVIQELADQVINLDKERLPKQRGWPRKDIATKGSIGTLDGENQVVQEFAAQVINSDQDRLPKQRGHPKKHIATKGSLGALNGENQVVQELAIQVINSDQECLPKQRGRPRKHIGSKGSLGALDGENQVVQELAIQVINSDKECLPKQRGQPRKHIATKGSLGALDGENQVVQELAVQVINSDREGLPKQIGRPRKHIATKGSLGALDGGNQVVQKLATQVINSDQKCLPKQRGRRRQHIATEGSLGPLDSENQVVQELAVQVIDSDQEWLPKQRGQRRKRIATKGSLGTLDVGNQVVQELGDQEINSDQELLPLFKKARDRSRKKQATEKTIDVDRENKFTQAVYAPLDRVKEMDSLPMKEAKGRPKKTTIRKKGRPNKTKVVIESINNLTEDRQSNLMLPTEDSSKFLAVIVADGSIDDHTMLNGCDKNESLTNSEYHNENALMCKALVTSTEQMQMDELHLACIDDVDPPVWFADNKEDESSVVTAPRYHNCTQNQTTPSDRKAGILSLDIRARNSRLSNDVALPRLVLCLAHNGKVAWDVKWRPSCVGDCEYKHRMGYLAVLLGNGSLEVWEVPSPSAIKFLYSSCQMDGTDPRFVKLEPVFKCSKLKCGDRHSIPLTVEWSPTFPHNFILAGCHDGMVALWKFSPSNSPQDTRPLLCFPADTLPIRALAWAPKEKSANLIATAGHGGLRFWDIRDPYRPLWDLNVLRRVVYSLDWLSDPRCVILSMDDGTLRTLSLSKAVYDVPATGKPFVGGQQQGLSSYFCSSFPIWSVQASRLAGLIAYCCADGSTLNFQLTTKAVEKDSSRNRASHFVCGSVMEEDTTLVVNSPLPNVPFPMKKSINEYGDTPRTIRGFLTVLNQAKRASSQAPENQTLAICYGDDPSAEVGSEATKATPQSNSTKRKSSDKKDAAPEATCPIGESENTPGGKIPKGEAAADFEVFPPKIVAMHRVRWNKNKGSERWLCYGGAAGVLRFQEVPLPSAQVKR